MVYLVRRRSYLMITMSQLLKDYVNGFESKKEFCDRFGISYPTFLSYVNGETSVGNEFIEKVLTATMWQFDKAFTVVEDSK